MIRVVEPWGRPYVYFVYKDDEPQPYDVFISHTRKLTWAEMSDVEAGYEEALRGYNLGGKDG